MQGLVRQQFGNNYPRKELHSVDKKYSGFVFSSACGNNQYNACTRTEAGIAGHILDNQLLRRTNCFGLIFCAGSIHLHSSSGEGGCGADKLFWELAPGMYKSARHDAFFPNYVGQQWRGCQRLDRMYPSSNLMPLGSS